MADRFEELRTFVAVVESGGFAAASERLGLVKSAVSRRVGDLEARLGAMLLERTGRRLRPTPAGEALRNRAERLLAELDRVEALAASDRPTLRVEAAPVALHLMATGLADFMSANPGVDVSVQARSAGAATRADVVVGAGGGKPFGEYRQLRCAAPSFLASLDGDPLTARILVATPAADPLHGPREIEAAAAMLEVEDLAGLVAAALAGCGVAVLPDFAAEPHVAAGSLTLLDSSDLPSVVLRAEAAGGATAELAAELVACLGRDLQSSA